MPGRLRGRCWQPDDMREVRERETVLAELYWDKIHIAGGPMTIHYSI